MNVTRYLELMHLVRKLPQSAPLGGERIGGRVEGPVLNGQRTLYERLADTASPDRVQRDREYYQSAADYDPVLKAHCRR